ncbi:MAG: hypothetical protein HYU97_11555 [Deltaproteobacteria bacterium]|nr:hypothetical protein [Deltaproteobacteria bacterium]
MLIFSIACQSGNQTPNSPNAAVTPQPTTTPIVSPSPPPSPPAPVPFFDTLLTPEQRGDRSEKYRPLFTSDRLLNAVVFFQEGPFPQWDDELKTSLLLMLIFYEENNGQGLPPFTGNCSLEGGENPCYHMRDLPRPHLNLIPEFSQYLHLTQMAWHLYVEANHLTPWSILNYSPENLSILFENSFSQPRLGAQYFMANFDITEQYKITRGSLRAPNDSHEDLLAPTALQTILNLGQFLGERLTHVRGTSDNNMGPQSPIWPYRTRNQAGALLYDAQGTPIPLPRHPTPKEILIYFDPHHDLRFHPEATVGPPYHIINGCWGGSMLTKALLSSINLPVEAVGDFFGFGGHAGVMFKEIEGNDYSLIHADDLYLYEWAYGLIRSNTLLDGEENWGIDGFSPFQELIPGYGVFQTNRSVQDFFRLTLEGLGLNPDQINLLRQELYHDFGGALDYDLRILAVRAIAARPPVQHLYMYCSEQPFLERRHLPLNFLTDAEVAAYNVALNSNLLLRRFSIFPRNNPRSCFELFFDAMNAIYKKKTGLELRGDEDHDGFENYRDCNIYQADPEPCEEAFRRSIGIVVSG